MEQEIKKLYRNDEGKIIFGVASGLGKYFAVDPMIVRVLFVLLSLLHGAGILLYIVLAVLIPKETGEAILPQETAEKVVEKVGKAANVSSKQAKKIVQKMARGKSHFLKDTKRVIGVMCVLGGVGALLNKFFFEWFQWDLMWMIALIVIGFYLVLTEAKHELSDKKATPLDK